MSSMRDWNPTADESIETGITLLEASAGTGKTYNIASVLLRLVAACGLKMRDILVVTFTRAATAELQDRIRARLSEAVAFIEGRGRAGEGDEVLEHLRDGARKAGADLWLRRLRAAQESFDECLISTIHGFCQRMLQQHAFESQTDFGLELVEDTSELRGELVDDWLSRELHPSDPERHAFLGAHGFSRQGLLNLADLALRDPDLPVLPAVDDSPMESWESERNAFAAAWESGGAESVRALFETAGARGVFGPPPGKLFKKPSCRSAVAEVSAWLAGRPGVMQELPNESAWSVETVSKHLAPGSEAPDNETLAQLRRLIGFRARAAACEKARFVAWLRAEFDRRMGARRQQSFQDLMRRLARVLGDPANPSREALRRAIGERFKAALIDEFQDTDAVQWQIFRELFGDDAHRLFLIGDPKQAIYAFRGANVHVYLSAKSWSKRRCYTMRRNFRSDARLLDALNTMMDVPGFFGEHDIDYVPVDAPARDDAAVDRIRHAAPWSDPYTAPLQLRFMDQQMDPSSRGADDGSPLGSGRLRFLLPQRVAEDIVELLGSGARLHDPSAPLAGADGFRPMHPGDIAVLVRTGAQAVAVQQALTRVGIASVLRGADSVLATEEAFELQLWLQALAAPGHDQPARTAATTRLFGRDGTLLARADAQEPAALREWDQWLSRLAVWRELYTQYGFLRTLRTAMQHDTLPSPEDPAVLEDVTVRVLRKLDGERKLTNLWHLAELLHDAETSERLHLAGLLAWLQRERVQRTVDSDFVELRLERDDEAVAIMTMHKAKGLEFPVVFLPYLTDTRGPSAKEPRVVPSPVHPVERILDLRPVDQNPESWEAVRREHAREQLRLFYVAVTRARSRCVLYAGHTENLALSALAAPLHAPRHAAAEDRLRAAVERVQAATRDELWSDLANLASRSSQARNDGVATIALSRCAPVAGLVRPMPAPARDALRARSFLRAGLDRDWRRHSYTSITQHAHAAYAGLGDDREGFDPDPEEGSPPMPEFATAAGARVPDIHVPDDAQSVPLAAFPAGADAGTFFHACFEHADFRWADPDATDDDGRVALRGLLEHQLPLHGFAAAEWAEPLTAHLLDVLRTPLGGPLGATRLCDIPTTDRLNELRFDFPIAGGGDHAPVLGDKPVDSRGIVEALRLRKRWLQSPGDERTVRKDYLDGLDRFGPLAGFMTGSIDMVFRHAADGHPRWYVVDYKSNRLDPRGTGRYPVQHFCPEAMRFEMEQHHYYVQYHLYVLALHRYLRFRLGARYDYDRDMGGVYYLFFRGMVGQHTPEQHGLRHGCFHDKPPYPVIDALDKLFEQAPRPAQGGAS